MCTINQSKLTNQHVLLDTNFIIKTQQYADYSYFDDLFLIFKNNNCIPIVNEFIAFEFMRGCKIKEHFQTKKEFIENLSGLSLPSDKNILEDGIKISNIYANKNINSNQISIVDCYISAYLKKYNKNLILVTSDINDFPLIIHDRIGTFTLDLEKEIVVLAFYKFNLDKYKESLKAII